jgi:fumarate reductase subunit C
MQSAKPGSTRTAPPQAPDGFPWSGPYLRHTLFGATGVVYLLLAFEALRIVWAAGSGPAAWNAVQSDLAEPLCVALHVVALAAVVFVGVRFYSLFPRAQPPRIGPAKPPPPPVLHAMLMAAWLGVTLLFAVILSGGLFG